MDIQTGQTNTQSDSLELDFVAKGIEKTFNGKQMLEVLKGVDITVARGEMVAIVGTSGTGKTTLLHILGTLDRPTKGSLFYKGEDVFLKNDSELSFFRNKTVGFVFQFHHLLPEFTALENIMIPGLISGLPKKELVDKAFDLITKVGLDQRTNHKVGELSGGEQQRIALARALIMQPAVLLADEPTGNLDPKTGHKVFELIQEINTTMALSTVMVTHNHELARQMDRCLTLSEGMLHESSF